MDLLVNQIAVLIKAWNIAPGIPDQDAYYPFWYEQVGPAIGDVRQSLLNFAGETLYLVSAPDY